MTTPLKIRRIVSQPFAENTFLVTHADGAECVVIDPGFEPEQILRQLDEQQGHVVAILNTHGHVDHIAGNAALKGRFPAAPLLIGAGDAIMLTDPWRNLSAMSGLEIVSPPADRLVHEGDVLEFLGLEWHVREIPGHSPGHVVYIVPGPTPVVFGGDVLFAGGIGRWDFPGGNQDTLLAGIREKLYTLPDTAIVYPGHGPRTTIGDERRSNPFTSGLVELE